ncbi:MAG: cell envelope integrity protein TolA [Desulfobacterales bacterium]|nr:cell envelope integrity protein TolA [Desulfobacterales bacterium]
MKENLNHPACLFYMMEEEPRTLFFTFAASAMLHMIFLGALIFVPGPKPYKHFSPSVINVSMVTLPGWEKDPGAGRLTGFELEKKIAMPEVSKISSKIDAKADQDTSEAVSVAPKRRTLKKSLKKETFKSSRVVKSAVARIEEKIETSRPNPIAEAIDHLKNKVATSGQKFQLGAGAMSLSTGAQGGHGAVGKRELELMDIYRAQISYCIEKNWAFSIQLAGRRTDLVAVVVIRIMQNGEIKDVWFEKKSGDTYFDESAYKAVMKSNPLPMLPKEYLHPHYNLGLIFTPSGLR